MAKYDFLPVENNQNRKPTVEEFAQRYNIDLTPVNKPDITGSVVGIIIILLIFGGLAWWLRKDYKKYKEQSKLWIFIVEVVILCIFVPILLKPLFEGLWANLYMLFN